MLTTEELTALLQVLQCEDRSFATISDLFNKSFSREEYHRLAISLRILLEDNYLNNSYTEMCVAFYLIHILSTQTVPSATQQQQSQQQQQQIAQQQQQQHDHHGMDGSLLMRPANTLSVLYEYIIQPIKLLKNTETKTPRDWEDEHEQHMKLAYKIFILYLVTGRASEVGHSPPPFFLLPAFICDCRGYCSFIIHRADMAWASS
eukprot:GEZU01024730.1.p1 GENE.GEZU01024730.1~~GEZU01024730.1.p1  ORF type:complete len:204 (-),score=29.65 GEZU01024730.1:576-1187(-)